jgi:citrate lyase beta subunit
MLIVSQNISNHNITFSNDVIYRINLAWINNLQELENLLKKHDKQKIFLDLPTNRIKPPNNKYSLDDIIPILNSYENIRYFAISNVNNANDLDSYNDLIPKNVTIIPKIESPDGITNVSEIVKAIPSQEKILMLDHDDLFSALTKLGEHPSKFKDYINELIKFCKESNITLLRTIGVIFSDEEKRITEYIN